MSKRNLILSILLVTALAFLQSGCAGTHVGAESSEDYNENPLMAAIPDGVNNKKAMDAAESALIGREWTVASRSDDEITGKLKHRAFDAKVIIKIEDRNLVLYSDAVYIDPQTEKVSSGVPYGWLQHLRDDMQDILAVQAHK